MRGTALFILIHMQHFGVPQTIAPSLPESLVSPDSSPLELVSSLSSASILFDSLSFLDFFSAFFSLFFAFFALFFSLFAFLSSFVSLGPSPLSFLSFLSFLLIFFYSLLLILITSLSHSGLVKVLIGFDI